MVVVQDVRVSRLRTTEAFGDGVIVAKTELDVELPLDKAVSDASVSASTPSAGDKQIW